MISIDIGTYCIKLLDFKPTKKHGLIISNIDIEYIENPEKKDLSQENIKNSFQKLIMRNNIKNESINVCVSDCIMLKQHIENPSGLLDDIEKNIYNKLNDFISFIPEKDRIVSFSILSLDKIKELGKANSHDVLLAVVEKNKIEYLLSLLKYFNLKVQYIMPGPAAFITSHIFNQTEPIEELCMYLDVGFTSTKVIFVQHGVILFAKSIDFAGKYFTDEISKKLNISFNEAETLKKEDTEVSSVISKVLENWIKEIKKVEIEFNKYFSGNINISQIFISGGGAKLKNINKYIKNALSCNIEHIDTFSRINANESDKTQKFNIRDDYLFTNCHGMYIREAFRTKMTVNLLPTELRIKRLLRYRYAYIGIFILLIAFSIVINLLIPDIKKTKSSNKNNNISREEYDKQLTLIKSISHYEKAFAEKKEINDLLMFLTEKTPQEVHLKQININRIYDSSILIEIKGESQKKIFIENYMDTLKHTVPYIKEINIFQTDDSRDSYKWKFKSEFIMSEIKKNKSEQ